MSCFYKNVLFFSRALIVVNNTLAYEVHWLRFQDLIVINWPSQTAARYQTKKVIDNKHLILLRKLKVFRTAITLQDTAFGSVCQVHPLTSTLAYTVHCLKFQDLSLIGPARVLKQHNRQSLRKS